MSSSRGMYVLEGSVEHMNMKDAERDNVLLDSLKKNLSDALIMRLLKDGVDPNILGRCGESPLLVALRRKTMIAAQELINKGADVNMELTEGGTVLHKIARNPSLYNPQALGFLLYYEGDVNLQIDLMTPFSESLWTNNVDEAQILIHYYDGNLVNILNTAILYQFDTNLASILMKEGAQVDYVKWIINEDVLKWALRKGGFDLFKFMWERLDYTISLEPISTLFYYLLELNCDVNNDDWLDCLNLLLNSSMAFELAKECEYVTPSIEVMTVPRQPDFLPHIQAMHKTQFFRKFFPCCKSRNVKLSDRLRIIHLALSLSIKVNFQDLVIAHDLFGFNEELDILIYFTKHDEDMMWRFHDEEDHLLGLFLGMKDNLHYLYPWSGSDCHAKPKYNCFGYFNRSYYNKFHYQQKPEIKKKMQSLPECPSLLELCRTAARQFIRKTYNVKEPYQFYDAVKQLNLPRCVEDVIRFKTPIYI